MGKTDSTGSYSYVCDGASPGSPVLSDGHAMYTPGLSENRAGVSSYAASDVLGNLWFMDNGSGQQTYYQDTTAFGVPSAISGTEAGAFKFGGANGCQTDADTGLILMGHRYYDPRIGRFISQDPIGDGTNWYAYTDNNPVNLTDPLGLVCDPFDSTGKNEYEIYNYVTSHGGLPGEEYETKDKNGNVIPGDTFTVAGITWQNTPVVAPQGFNINQDIMAARNFYHNQGAKPDPKAIGAYLYNHYHPGNKHGDPKIYGKQYDKYGHVIYAAAASELRVTIGTIIDAQVDVHNLVHGTLEGENSSGDLLGWSYDQHFFHPGKGIYTDNDVFPGGVEEAIKSYL